MRVSGFALLLLALGCAPRDPPEWPRGGAVLILPSARWARGDDDPVEIMANGQVLEGGKLVFVIDRVGRVADSDYDPFAILLPDGRLVGTDNQYLGQLGVTNAAPPWSEQAWLSVLPDGKTIGFSPDGERATLGVWQGCAGPALRSCTLVTHLLTLRHHGGGPSSPVRFGVGVGVWL